MNIFSLIYQTILYRPLFNLLIAFYIFLPGHDFGIAVILLTLLIKIILSPLSIGALKSQRALSKLQPKIKEIQTKFKHNREKMSRALMELYRKEKINPLSGCLPLLVQLPILIALYQVFLTGLSPEKISVSLYGFLPRPSQLNLYFLGFLNLKESNIYLALIAGITQYFQSKLSFSFSENQKFSSREKALSFAFQKQMLYFFPVLTIILVWKLGAVIGLYWIVSTIYSIFEQIIITKKFKLS